MKVRVSNLPSTTFPCVLPERYVKQCKSVTGCANQTWRPTPSSSRVPVSASERVTRQNRIQELAAECIARAYVLVDHDACPVGARLGLQWQAQNTLTDGAAVSRPHAFLCMRVQYNRRCVFMEPHMIFVVASPLCKCKSGCRSAIV